MTDSDIVQLLSDYKEGFAPVVHFEPSRDKIIHIDLSEKNKELTPELYENTTEFSAYINGLLNQAGARYGIGGYGENRSLYGRSHVFDPLVPGAEPRRIHMGTDIWGKPLTAVMAPLDGIVHSFAYNDAFGNYGATIILSHYLPGHSFHTLYGHLSLNSIKNVTEGDRIEKGAIFGDFGLPFENGQWPPHLHFQLIIDLEDWKGDYPGVCTESEKEKYFNNCPDPDLVLGMMKYVR